MGRYVYPVSVGFKSSNVYGQSWFILTSYLVIQAFLSSMRQRDWCGVDDRCHCWILIEWTLKIIGSGIWCRIFHVCLGTGNRIGFPERSWRGNRAGGGSCQDWSNNRKHTWRRYFQAIHLVSCLRKDRYLGIAYDLRNCGTHYVYMHAFRKIAWLSKEFMVQVSGSCLPCGSWIDIEVVLHNSSISRD